MWFFGKPAAIAEHTLVGGQNMTLEDTVQAPTVAFTKDDTRPADSALRTLYCRYPPGDPLGLKSG